MVRTIKKLLLMIFILIFSFTVVNCTKEESKIENKDYSKISVDGQLTIPFDIAYSQEIDNGSVKYDESHLLIKMGKEFNGKINSELSACGIVSIEKKFDVDNGVWYKAEIDEFSDIKECISLLRKTEEVLLAEYDYVCETDEFVEDDIELSSETNSNIDWAHKDVRENESLDK